MATGMSASTFVGVLKAEGVTVQEYKSWRTHNRNHMGAWGPVNGVMIHHTVSSADDSSVALCYNGHSSLPGPLCHSVGRNDGKIAMVGHGRANHAGSGDSDVLRAVINETALPADNAANTDGNKHFYGLEIVNLGNGKDTYTAKQYDSAVRWAAAICRYHGWSARSVIGHKEWQPGKIDPHGPVEGKGAFSMNTFRADVQKRLNGSASSGAATPEKEDENMALTDADIKALATRDGIFPAPRDASDYSADPKNHKHYWSLASHQVTQTENVRALRKEVAALTALVKSLAAKL